MSPKYPYFYLFPHRLPIFILQKLMQKFIINPTMQAYCNTESSLSSTPSSSVFGLPALSGSSNEAIPPFSRSSSPIYSVLCSIFACRASSNPVLSSSVPYLSIPLASHALSPSTFLDSRNQIDYLTATFRPWLIPRLHSWIQEALLLDDEGSLVTLLCWGGLWKTWFLRQYFGQESCLIVPLHEADQRGSVSNIEIWTLQDL